MHARQVDAGLAADVHAELNIPADQNIILAVGRVVPQKRPFLWLDWVDKLHRQLPNTRFVWVGGGELADDFDRTARARNLLGGPNTR